MKTEIELKREEVERYRELVNRSYGRWQNAGSHMIDGKWHKSGKERLDELIAELKELEDGK